MQRPITDSTFTSITATVAALVLMTPAASTAFSPCQLPDDGRGTVQVPPIGCPYVSPEEDFLIVDGLPAGASIELDPELQVIVYTSEGPGGALGGDRQEFEASIEWLATGTGDLNGYSRTLVLPLAVVTHTGPRIPGDAVQSFPMEISSLQGAIGGGDPDFDELVLTAGATLGMPSPGLTTLTRLGPPGSDFAIESFFDISYQIDFVGAPGGPLNALSGRTIGTIRMRIIPEPASVMLLVMGFVGVLVSRRRLL